MGARERADATADALDILASTMTGRWPVVGEPAEMWVRGLTDEQLVAFLGSWPAGKAWDFTPRTEYVQ